jgi:hypothetical protein
LLYQPIAIAWLERIASTAAQRGEMKTRIGLFLTMAAIIAMPIATAVAEPDIERTIVIKDHRFEPTVTEVPAGKRVKLIVHNQDATPEEFESTDLRREKIVVGNSKVSVWVGPLPKGEYGFFGDFHQDTAKGRLIAQ